jgi:hypothetical protein
MPKKTKKIPKKKIISCERYVSDFTGSDICPGNVVGVGRAQGKKFHAKIVTKITKHQIYFADYARERFLKYNPDGTPKMITRKNWRGPYTYQDYDFKKVAVINKKYSQLEKGEVQQHIVLVRDPLFAIHNKQIKHLLELADALKDEGLLPPEYKLGQTLVEFEEEEAEG